MAIDQDQSVHIVLIDDDEVDAEAVARLLQRQHAPYRLTVFSSGGEAQNAFAGAFGRRLLAERYLILLDLNMPRMNGFEFLDWLRTQPVLLRSIVFIFSTSDTEVDRHQAYERQIAGYLAKSRLGHGYCGLLTMLDVFCREVSFPPAEPAS